MNENLFVSDFPKKNLSVVQDKNAFCFGLDAVLLSDFAVAKNKSEVFDLGTGNGIIPLLMAEVLLIWLQGVLKIVISRTTKQLLVVEVQFGLLAMVM